MKQVGVLVVDDSPGWVERLGEFARQADLKILGAATSPSEAIAAVDRLKPPIIILDMYLSGGNGMEVLEALHSLPIQTRIVVLTCAPSERLRKACSNLGARYFFDKAMDLEDLGPALNTLKAESRV